MVDHTNCNFNNAFNVTLLKYRWSLTYNGVTYTLIYCRLKIYLVQMSYQTSWLNLAYIKYAKHFYQHIVEQNNLMLDLFVNELLNLMKLQYPTEFECCTENNKENALITVSTS